MKLIKQSFEILKQKDFSLIGIKKFIERCGRVCYKSEDRITDDSSLSIGSFFYRTIFKFIYF